MQCMQSLSDWKLMLPKAISIFKASVALIVGLLKVCCFLGQLSHLRFAWREEKGIILRLNQFQ